MIDLWDSVWMFVCFPQSGYLISPWMEALCHQQWGTETLAKLWMWVDLGEYWMCFREMVLFSVAWALVIPIPHATNHVVINSLGSGAHWKPTQKQVWIVRVEETERGGIIFSLPERDSESVAMTQRKELAHPASRAHRQLFVILISVHSCINTVGWIHLFT